MWVNVSDEMIRELSQTEVNDMLLSVALRNVREEWKKEMHEKPKVVNDGTDFGVWD